MKILIALNHPAHYYLFKFIAKELKNKGHDVRFVIKGKDILEKILISEGVSYTKLLNRKKCTNNIFSVLTGLFLEMIRQDISLFRYIKAFRPDLMLGTDISISHIGLLKNIPTLIFNEDDINVNKIFCYCTYPFATHIITPVICSTGLFKKKQIKYNGFQKLAYLHPHWFKPDFEIVKKYSLEEKPYFLIRLVSYTSGHDVEARHSGINTDTLRELIFILKTKGNVYISSEKRLGEEFRKYELLIDPSDIHHLMYYSELIIADSQSMIVEAAMIGVPCIRFNSFVGKISVLNELEEKYELTKGIINTNTKLLFEMVYNLINTEDLKESCKKKCEKMLADKIDVTTFLVWLIENYPESIEIVKKNSDFW